MKREELLSGKYKILIVDDSEFIRNLIKKTLLKTGNFIIYEAVNGKNGYEVLKEHKDIECIILDLVMPEIDGWGFLELKNKDPELEKIPVIVDSSLADIDNIIKALEFGSYDYFTKPLKPNELQSILPLKLKNAINSYRLQKYIEIQNVKFKSEINLAKKLIFSLLPDIKNFKEVEIVYRYIPFASIGGDFIDFTEREDSFFFMVADISGHGIVASLIFSLLKEQFNRLKNTDMGIEELAKNLNETISNLFEGSIFITLFAGEIQKSKNILYYINGGHPAPFLVRNKKALAKLNSTVPLIGIFDDIKYEKKSVEFFKDDILFLYTDGAFELEVSPGKIFGEDNLKKLVFNSLRFQSTIGDALENIFKKIDDYKDGIGDDILITFIKRT